MIVLKFGGTSVKTASAMMQAADIVVARRDQGVLVVLSACGGITDKLLAAANAAADADTQTLEQILSDIHRHHIAVCHELISQHLLPYDTISEVESLLAALREYCEGIALLCECTPQSYDAVASFGERLSSCIFCSLLQEKGHVAELLDARECMRTDDVFMRATVQMPELRVQAQKRIIPRLAAGAIVVTQGFIASDHMGRTTTLGRGGSDLSAALFGAAIDADEIQIWTDVNGVLSTDPRIVKDALTISEISFSEIRQLAYFGAKVLHPDTIKPAVDTSIPVKILNTFEPEHQGTTIVQDSAVHEPMLRAVSLLRSCALLREEVSVHQRATTALTAVLSTAAQHGTEILLCFAEDSSLGCVIRSNDSYRFERDDRRIDNVDLLCICGPALSGSQFVQAVSARLSPFSPRCVLYGISDVSIIALVDPGNSVAALQSLHELIVQQHHHITGIPS